MISANRLVNTDSLAAGFACLWPAGYCRRYMGNMLRTCLISVFGLALNAQAQTSTKIPYESPRAAYVALSKDPNSKLKSNAEGWQIVNVSEGSNEGIWTFAPQAHPSFPSVVKRQVIESNGQLFMSMDVLCGGTKPACEQYVAEFVKMNEQMSKELNEKRSSVKGEN
jgi:hypothetical protein